MGIPADALVTKLLNRLRLRSLVVFIAVFEERNVTAAAQKVGLTQSAVSKKILELEEVVGSPLFTREANGVQPTLVGFATYAVCLRMITSAHEFARNLTNLHLDQKLSVSLGFAPGYYSRRINGVISNLTKLMPHCNVSVSTMSRKDLLNGMRCRTLTLAVGVKASDIQGGVRVLNLPPIRLGALFSDRHPLLKSRCIESISDTCKLFQISSLEDMKQYRWILPPREDLISESFESSFGRFFTLPHLETTSFYEALMLVKSTHFLMLVTEEAMNSLLQVEGFAGILLPQMTAVQDAVAAICVEDQRGTPCSFLEAIEGLSNELVMNSTGESASN